MIPYFRIDALELFGPVAIQPWGVLVALGFILGTMVCRRYAAPRGMDPDAYADIVVWLALGGLVFGHLGHAFFYQWDHYSQNPLELLKVWDGLSSYGGYIGCTFVAIVFFRRRKLNVLKFGDILMLGLAFGIFVGRLGCFVVHDHIGVEVRDTPAFVQTFFGWLAIEFPPGTAEPGRASLRFDGGLLESLNGLVTFTVLAVLARKPRFPGLLLGAAPIVYGVGRFFNDFARHSDLATADNHWGPFTPAQWFSCVLVVVGTSVLLANRSKPAWPDGTEVPWDKQGKEAEAA
ncbi:MAG: prolipoprotein diacylglyceryl transferase [Deltaproteobacteria bacterium]|nr:prolipoprotein diacylglyceryl transferase [Deltaproteobacteria bacterium]